MRGPVVVVRIIRGRGLPAKDRNGFSDPYCTVVLANEDGTFNKETRRKTKVVKKSLDPQWDDSVSL